jgi:histidinol-phosphate aminotransferase
MNGLRPHLEKLLPYTPGEQPRGGKFIKLNTNENPYPPSEAVVQAIVETARNGLQRYPDPLATAFRQQAASLFGLPGPDWILCGNGSDEILTLLVRAFVGEGELLRLPSPSYILYRTLAEIQNARWEQIPFREDWSLPDSFCHESPGLKLAFLPNPNSPSGSLLTAAQVLEIAHRLPCPLVVDEAYADFADENSIGLVQRSEKVIVTRSLSKSYALAGLRFGFCIARPDVIRELCKLKDSYNCDTLSLAGALAAIGDQKWLLANRKRVIDTRERVIPRLRELGFDVPPSQANFVWCTRDDQPVQPLYAALKDRQILVRYMNYAGVGDGLRISVGTDEQMDACLQVLGQILRRS